MKRILVVIAILLTPTFVFADSFKLRPLESPPDFSYQVVLSYVAKGTGRPALLEACMKAKNFLKGSKRIEVTGVRVDEIAGSTTCTVTGEGRSE